MYLKESILSALLFFVVHISAQTNNCGNTEPIIAQTPDSILCFDELSDSILVLTNSNLPDLEYAIVDESVPADNGSGPSIINIDIDGQFIPLMIGVDSATQLQVFPFAYDLVVIQDLIDDLLGGNTGFPFFIPCCTLAADICTFLNGAGINSGSDIMSMAQVYDLFAPDTANYSILDFIDVLDSVNMQLSDPLIPSGCGGGTMICYAYGQNINYQVLGDSILIVDGMHTISEDITAPDQIVSHATVIPGIIVNYYAGNTICLDTGFTVEPTGEFLAETLMGCN